MNNSVLDEWMIVTQLHDRCKSEFMVRSLSEHHLQGARPADLLSEICESSLIPSIYLSIKPQNRKKPHSWSLSSNNSCASRRTLFVSSLGAMPKREKFCDFLQIFLPETATQFLLLSSNGRPMVFYFQCDCDLLLARRSHNISRSRLGYVHDLSAMAYSMHNTYY